MSEIQYWHYLDRSGEQIGPVEGIELLELAKLKKIGKEDYVWTDGLPEWIRAARVDGLFSVADPVMVEACPEKQKPKAGSFYTVPLETVPLQSGVVPIIKRERVEIGKNSPPSSELKSFTMPSPAAYAEQSIEPVTAAEAEIALLDLPHQSRATGQVSSSQVAGGIKCGCCETVSPALGVSLPEVTQCVNPNCQAELVLTAEKYPVKLDSLYKSFLGGLLLTALLLVIGGLIGGASLWTSLTLFIAVNGFVLLWLVKKQNEKAHITSFNKKIRKKILEHDVALAKAAAQRG